jgi:hypothetical protein
VALCIVHRDQTEPARRVPGLAYALPLIVFGSAASFAGMIEGMRLACPRARNLCGLFWGVRDGADLIFAGDRQRRARAVPNPPRAKGEGEPARLMMYAIAAAFVCALVLLTRSRSAKCAG